MCIFKDRYSIDTANQYLRAEVVDGLTCDNKTRTIVHHNCSSISMGDALLRLFDGIRNVKKLGIGMAKE